MAKFVFVECEMDPSTEDVDLVSEIEKRLGVEIKRCVYEEFGNNFKNIWSADTFVWFNKLLSNEDWTRLTAGVPPKKTNAMFCSTRLGRLVADTELSTMPDFDPDQEPVYIEFSEAGATAMFDAWGCMASCVVPSPLVNWDIVPDGKCDMTAMKQKFLAGTGKENILTVLFDCTTNFDMLHYAKWARKNWLTAFYMPFCSTGDFAAGDGAVQYGNDVSMHELLLASDAIVTPRYFGPEYVYASMFPANKIIACKGIMSIQNDIGMNLFRSWIKFYSQCVVSLDIDFMESETAYVQYKKTQDIFARYGNIPERLSGFHIDYAPTASSRQDAFDKIVEKFKKVMAIADQRAADYAAIPAPEPAK